MGFFLVLKGSTKDRPTKGSGHLCCKLCYNVTYRPPQTQKHWDGTRVPTLDVYSLDGLVALNCWNQPQRILLKVEVQESGVTWLLPHDARTLAKAPAVATNIADRKHSNLLVLVFTSSALSSEIKPCT